jgi:CheY-like chemotaxis protein
VLLVEDSVDLRAGIRDMLTELRHTVIEATTVDEALALLAELPDITLILSDISLEGHATGLDLVDRLPDAAPPCILMTSLPPEHDWHARALTCAPVLRKPFTARDLGAFLSTQGSSP